MLVFRQMFLKINKKMLVKVPYPQNINTTSGGSWPESEGVQYYSYLIYFNLFKKLTKMGKLHYYISYTNRYNFILFKEKKYVQLVSNRHIIKVPIL